MDALEGADYRVWHASDGGESRALVERAHPDLILLDLFLPDVDGLVLCSMLKSIADVPIVICSASSRRSDPVLSLKLGADDFVRQPFDVEDLLARIEAVLRRAPRPAGVIKATALQTPNLRLSELVIEPPRRRASVGGERLLLTPIEFRLLTILTAHAEHVLTRDQLALEVWGYTDASNGRTIDVHIRRLRVKLGQSGASSPTIVSVRGMGYRITAEAHATSAA
jgi:DNA-binding response OmpR family regulator